MKLNIIPICSAYEWRDFSTHLLFVKRGEDEPYLLMRDVVYKIEKQGYSTVVNSISVMGSLIEGHAMTELQDDDVLLLFTSGSDDNLPDACYCELYAISDTLLTSFDCKPEVLYLADAMYNSTKVIIGDLSNEETLNTAEQIKTKLQRLYDQYPAYRHIMIKKNGKTVAMSLSELVAEQTPERQKTLISMILALPSGVYYRSHFVIIKKILEMCEYEEEFSLLTQEEQISSFIDFSRQVTAKKIEYVPDTMIDMIKASSEYQQVLEKLDQNGLGISDTQQFNVFQSVGYFSKHPNSRRSGNLNQGNIIYNLSDMGAGKTLMTVESIYLLDLKQISAWNASKEEILNENVTVHDIRVPDKHIIAPTLSVKSSWIDTFKLFYDVEETDEDFKYELTCTFGDTTAHSTIYVVPFTVKNGCIFNQGRLPVPNFQPYLIIDEIHQLIKKKIAKSKFFAPKTVPVENYDIFILSGTMSNMQTHEWFNFLNFMGIKLNDLTVQQCVTNAENLHDSYYKAISESAENIRKDAHRYFDAPPVTRDEYHRVEHTKMTGYEEYFYMRYGSQAILPTLTGYATDEGRDVDSLLHNCNLVVNPAETDTINFELFYEIIGSQAITAQSLQVAEELFGDQKTQHLSDVIKTVSPLSQDDLQILKTLHHIAADSDKYKSLTISKAINNGILNLNDGLQTKNLYDLIAGFAEKNLRFFNYLASLDVNILERLQQSGLIETPKLEETQKFKVLKDILEREQDETHLIVVNDFYALKSLSDALGIEHITKDDLKNELNYQNILDALFEKQSIVIVTQDMIKSSLDLVQANRLIQYQLNTEISDIIQTQNRINRIGQTRETKGYYIATDQLQENLIELFLESYRNIRVAHKGIVELFTDLTTQINVVNDYLEKAFVALENDVAEEVVDVVEEAGDTVEEVTEEMEADDTTEEVTEATEETEDTAEEVVEETNNEAVEETTENKEILDDSDLVTENAVPKGEHISVNEDGYTRALLYPQNDAIMVFVPLTTGTAFLLGTLKADIQIDLTGPKEVLWDLDRGKLLGGVAA